ncbi:molecular chaperone HtpG [Porphyromonas gingivicanis]|uniref:molecular chaperone HtpG n=1 Tax=Porphyromonas gingivicanis TaxID=266762 RepID=UPI00046F8D31|nr:molecular chaperone HtpG [Porphyromonas gingivicanis]
MAITGKIGVTSENIFPIIKKFLYSDHDIFLRELVSNAVDATTKLQTIARNDQSVGELGTPVVRVEVDAEAKTITISDQGVGMTQEEVESYINQIAFSGAEDFLKKYEGSNTPIIGHFGLGFYSAFMVSKMVEIDTLSYKEGAKAVHWSCDGSPEYTLTPSERKERGTTITLHIDEESTEFLSRERLGALLDKYCRFLPTPVIFGKKQEWKDGKMVDTEEENQINETHPLWVKTPSDLKEEDYKEFHRQLYPNSDEPLFWIHLNVDYPFTLKGVLFFPKIKPNVELQKNRIKLFCNQVFVTDHVEDIVPEWLTLLEGVIDSPDIPLNVSRSYLQNDTNAQKIARHISKKVSDKLTELFQSDRPNYEAKWESIGLFVHYGMLTDEKTYERLLPAMLLKDTEGKYFTMEEYRQLIDSEQTNKDGNTIVLYATDKKEQYVSLKQATDKGYNVLLMDGPLGLPLMNMLEQKQEKLHFARVDSDTIERLIEKEQKNTSSMNVMDEELLRQLFSLSAPQEEGKMFHVQIEHTESSTPIELIQGEWMRRMKDMSRFQSGMAFYDTLPDSFNLVVNTQHPIIKNIFDQLIEKEGKELRETQEAIKTLKEQQASIVKEIGDTSEDNLSDELKTKRAETTASIESEEKKLSEKMNAFIGSVPQLDQLWDLALLSRGLLAGERLSLFMKRSCDLLL